MTTEQLLYESLLTRIATCASSLRNRYCPMCSQLQFKGDAIDIEIRCRRCKTMVVFQGETVRAYQIKPY